MNMGQNNVKKSWTQPEMIVLVRSEPEEVLQSDCKTSAAYGVGADEDAQVQGCSVKDTANCSPCQARGGGGT